MSIKTYSELITFRTFEERYQYCRLGGQVGIETFGFDRYLNQVFYHSAEWKKFRSEMIVRDLGCDLGIDGRDILGTVILHHLNPIDMNDIINRRIEVLLNPENVICVSLRTHNAIHYGDDSLLITEFTERSANDTCPWLQ